MSIGTWILLQIISYHNDSSLVIILSTLFNLVILRIVLRPLFPNFITFDYALLHYVYLINEVEVFNYASVDKHNDVTFYWWYWATNQPISQIDSHSRLESRGSEIIDGYKKKKSKIQVMTLPTGTIRHLWPGWPSFESGHPIPCICEQILLPCMSSYHPTCMC